MVIFYLSGGVFAWLFYYTSMLLILVSWRFGWVAVEYGKTSVWGMGLSGVVTCVYHVSG